MLILLFCYCCVVVVLCLELIVLCEVVVSFGVLFVMVLCCVLLL